VAALIERIVRRVVRKVDTAIAGAGAAHAEPLLASLAGASVAGVVATGRRRGARSLRIGSGDAAGATIASRRCASMEGFTLHAAVRVRANDRAALEHLARYLGRPPIASERLSRLADGRVMLRFKRPFSDGTEAIVFTPFELIERLLPLIPRPRKHTIRFHGILAPAAGFRSKVVPSPPPPTEPRKPGADREPSPYRLPWAELLRRVFLVDVFECPRCHGRMRIVSAVTDPCAVERILLHLRHSTAPPALFPPRAPPDGGGGSTEPCPFDLRDPDPLEGTSC
jgi:hypothetical protein